MKKQFVIILIIFQLININNCEIYPSKNLTIDSAQGFLIFLKTPFNTITKNNELIKCNLLLRNSLHNINLITEYTEIIVTDQYELIKRFSQTVCGVRVENITNESIGEWKLLAEYSDGYKDTDILYLDVLQSKKFPLIINQVANSESLAIVKCPYTDYNPRYCRMIDNNGIIYENLCETTISLLQNQNKYLCKSLLWGTMLETNNQINILPPIQETIIVMDLIETKINYILKCKYKYSLTNCFAESPNKLKRLHLADGLLTKNYSSYDTQKKNGLCTLEIMKPIDINDYGIWRIYINKLETGCLFNIGNITNDIIINKLELTKIQPIIMNVKNNLTNILFKCEIPLVIDYCYIEHVDTMEIEYLNSIQLEKTRTLGKCEFNKIPKNGKWICGMKPINGNIIETHYMINIYTNISSEILYDNLEKKNEGDTIEILCKTLFDYTIKFCHFKSPTNKWYTLTKNKLNSVNRIEYYGKGFEYGDCGIKINNVIEEDFGNWTCIFQIVQLYDGKDIQSLTILVEENVSVVSSAMVIGLSVGASIIVIISLILFIIYRYKLKRTNQTNEVRAMNDIIRDSD